MPTVRPQPTKPIRSRDNPRYKEFKRLATVASARARSGLTLLDGVHLCGEWLAHCGQPQTCVVAQGALANQEVAALLSRVESARRVVLDDALFAPLAQVEHGPGLLFIVAVPRPALPARVAGPCVLLDRLQDPGNLGSILRSAAAAGVGRVLCAPGTVAAWSPKVLRAGMGAHFRLAIHEDCDLALLLPTIAGPVLAMSSHATASLYTADLTGASWLFGNEGQGVAPALMNAGVVPLVIPQPGGMESLNVAATAAVCLFEQVRQGLVKQR